MGNIDWVVVHTLEELLDSQDKFRQGVLDGGLVPLWLTETMSYFAYQYPYEQRMLGGHNIVMTLEEMEDVFIAEQRAFQAQWN